jgi:hypothetical protein
MYLARFSYDVLPINRQRAIDFIKREVEAAHGKGLNARLLVPLTRGHGNGAALQFEVELTDLDQIDQFRSRGVGSAEETGNWMHAFSEVVAAPPCVEILRFEGAKAGYELGQRGSARASRPIRRRQIVGTFRAL